MRNYYWHCYFSRCDRYFQNFTVQKDIQEDKEKRDTQKSAREQSPSMGEF